jgi:hypothetical protein
MSGKEIGFNFQPTNDLDAAREQTPKTKTLLHQTVSRTDK